MIVFMADAACKKTGRFYRELFTVAVQRLGNNMSGTVDLTGLAWNGEAAFVAYLRT